MKDATRTRRDQSTKPKVRGANDAEDDNEQLNARLSRLVLFHAMFLRYFVPIYNTYIRPLLEYNTVVWSPSLKCDTCNVEKVQ